MILNFALLTLLMVCAIAAAMSTNLFANAIILGCYSFTFAALIASWGGLDVAFTEAVVSSGVGTLFFICLLWTTKHHSYWKKWNWEDVGFGFLVVLMLGGGWWVLSALPAFGDPLAAVHTHVSPVYIERAIHDTNTPNIVTAVLGDYRGFDTLMETVVIFTAAMACWLLGLDRK